MNVVQIEQDFAICADKFPSLICRPVGAQFMNGGIIALFEFEKVENDVVGLALAIARKILHRESQIDPLLLTGIVRVALENVSHETRVLLRVNPQEIRFWRDYFSQTPEIHPVPELLGDASLTPGQCVLETDVGNTQISLETQLKEIEQGFLDLLQQRPRVEE